MTAGGTIAVTVDAGAVTDPAGNANAGSNAGLVTFVHSGSLQFSAPTYSVDEQGTPTLTVTVTRAGGSDGTLSVNYATADGTAVAGTDYSGVSGTLNWIAGDANSRTVTIPILDDGGFEADSTFTVGLSNFSLAGALGNPSSATVTIQEKAGLGFAAASVPATNGTPVTVVVHRQFDSHGVVTVDYATANGTATAGVNYTAASGTLTWADGNSADQTLTIPVLNDTTNSGNETFTVTLSNPTGNALAGPVSATTVTIGKHNGVTVQSAPPKGLKPSATFTDANGDEVTISLGGKTGTATYYLTEGRLPFSEIDLAGTDPTKTTVTIAVKKPKGATAAGLGIGEVDGTGFKTFTATGWALDGAGFNLTDYAGAITVGDVFNGADFNLPAALPAKAKGVAISAGVIADGTDINVATPLKSLTAIAVGKGSISAPSVGAITVKGKAKTKTAAAIPGDFRSSLTIAGTGLAPKVPALKSFKVAGAVSGSDIRVGVGGTISDVGSVSVGSFIDSTLFAGYDGPTDGSVPFNLASTVKSFTVTSKTNAFARSFVIATNFNTVSLASVDPANSLTKFGFLYHGLLKSLSVKSTGFKFNPKGPTEQDMPSSDFYLKKV
jgi:hypothetical protein